MDHAYSNEMAAPADHQYSQDVSHEGSFDHVYACTESDSKQSTTHLNMHECYKKSQEHYFSHMSKIDSDVQFQAIRNLAITTKNTKDFVNGLMDIKGVLNIVENKIIERTDVQLTLIASKIFNSIHRCKITSETNINKMHSQIVGEVLKESPFLLRFLLGVTGVLYQANPVSQFCMVPLISMIMYQRNKELSAFQKLVTVACARYHANNDLIAILHRYGLAIHANNKNLLLEKVANTMDRNLVHCVQLGLGFKITVDNIDGRMITNHVRKNSGNKDYHYTHFTVLPDRFSECELNIDDTPKLVAPEAKPDLNIFYVSNSELQKLKESYTLLVANILCEEIAAFNVFKKCLPQPSHTFSHITNRKSESFPMFVILENSNSIPGCVRILDNINSYMSGIYKEAGKENEFNSNNITVGVIS